MKYLYETHMHTTESSACAEAHAVEQVREYKNQGYTGIIITDHIKSQNFTLSRFKQLKPLMTWDEKIKFFMTGYEKAKAEGDKVGIDVFLGWEFNYMGSDFLTYGLDAGFLLRNKNIDEMPIEAYSAIVRESGGYIAQAHPYRKLPQGKRQIPVSPNLLDGIEVFNAQRYVRGRGTENDKALEFAHIHGLPMQAGTDSHKIGRRFYSGIVMEERANNIFDIVNAIKAKKVDCILPGKSMVLTDMESEDSMLVKVFYDSKYAKEAAEGLSDYIENSMEISTLCADIEQEGIIDRTARITKTIIIGRHSDTKNRLRHIKALRYDKYGLRYGLEGNLCVMTASRSELRKSKSDYSSFIVDYCKRFSENPKDEHTRSVQFKYLTMEFIMFGLNEFMGVEPIFHRLT